MSWIEFRLPLIDNTILKTHSLIQQMFDGFCRLSVVISSNLTKSKLISSFSIVSVGMGLVASANLRELQMLPSTLLHRCWRRTKDTSIVVRHCERRRSHSLINCWNLRLTRFYRSRVDCTKLVCQSVSINLLVSIGIIYGNRCQSSCRCNKQTFW